ncbi:hypothetical protein FRC07_011876, partial [Ceratobasidium sp. 392]
LKEPLLWNYIHVSQKSHLERAQAYLRRVGRSILLDIDLEFGPRMDRASLSCDQGDYSRKILLRLVSMASMQRWKSLVVASQWPEILLELIEMVNISSTPELRFVSLKWNYKLDHDIEDQEQSAELRCAVEEPVHALFPNSDQRPLLHRVELEQFPAAYVFGCQVPVVRDLTHLKLTTNLGSISGLRAVLASNRRLESLALCSPQVHIDEADSAVRRLRMDYLRSFSLDAIADCRWGVRVLRLVKAPNIEAFEYFGEYEDNLSSHIIDYITTGTTTNNDYWLGLSNNKKATRMKPIYPALRMLKIGQLYSDNSQIHKLLTAYPEVTSLEIHRANFFVLSHVIPLALPQLQRLRILEIRPRHLKAARSGLILMRAERELGGLPLCDVKLIDESGRDVTHSPEESEDEEPPEAESVSPTTYTDDESVLSGSSESQESSEPPTPGSWPDCSNPESVCSLA